MRTTTTTRARARKPNTPALWQEVALMHEDEALEARRAIADAEREIDALRARIVRLDERAHRHEAWAASAKEAPAWLAAVARGEVRHG